MNNATCIRCGRGIEVFPDEHNLCFTCAHKHIDDLQSQIDKLKSQPTSTVANTIRQTFAIRTYVEEKIKQAKEAKIKYKVKQYWPDMNQTNGRLLALYGVLREIKKQLK